MPPSPLPINLTTIPNRFHDFETLVAFRNKDRLDVIEWPDQQAGYECKVGGAK